MSPRLALLRTLLAAAAVLILAGLAATAEAPRARWVMWAFVVLGALQAFREARRYVALRTR